jgi:uncharacterized protein YbbC (DUF1343 family)
VLDRPNPITGAVVEGPLLDERHKSFVGYFPMPVRHGMTVGELAEMFNQENRLGARLHVIRMEGWEREDWFDETGLPWVNPSPNIRTLEQALLYPGIALLEGLSNYSVGRGTDMPFAFVGADWIDGRRLAAYLNNQQLQAVRAYARQQTPAESRFAGATVDGIQITVLDRDRYWSTRVGLELASFLSRTYPNRINLQQTAGLIGDDQTIEALEKGESPATIWEMWETELQPFLTIRQKYLIY